jgi:hypothetical protein
MGGAGQTGTNQFCDFGVFTLSEDCYLRMPSSDKLKPDVQNIQCLKAKTPPATFLLSSMPGTFGRIDVRAKQIRLTDFEPRRSRGNVGS